MIELVDLIKFNAEPSKQKMNAQVISVAGSEENIYIAKSAAVAFRIQGWESRYIGNIGELIDPFFDLDFQRYISRTWGNKRGIMVICIFSSGEGSLRFISSTAKFMKGRLKGELRIVSLTTQQLKTVAEENSDYVATDLVSLLDWVERQYNIVVS
jgi:hypothetical protein